MPGPSGDILGGLGTVGAAYFELAADDDRLVRGLEEAVAEAKAAVAEGSGDMEIGVKLDASWATFQSQLAAVHAMGKDLSIEAQANVYGATAQLAAYAAAERALAADTSRLTEQTVLFDVALHAEEAALSDATGQLSFFTVASLAAAAAQRDLGNAASEAARQQAAGAAIGAGAGGTDMGAGGTGGGGGGFLGGLLAGGGGGGLRRALPWGARFLMPTTAAGWLAFHVNPTLTEVAGLAQAIAGLTAGVATIMGIGAAMAYVTVQAGRMKEAITGQAPAIDLYVNTVQAHFQRLGQSIQQSLTGPGQTGLAAISGGLILLSNQVAGMFRNLFQGAGGQQFLGFVISQLQTWTGVVGQFFSNIGSSFMRFWTSIQPVAMAFVRGLGGLLHSLFQTAGSVIGPITSIAAPGILQFFSALGHLIAAWEPLMAGFEHAFLGVMQLTNAIVSGLAPATAALAPVIAAVSGTLGIFAQGLSFVAPLAVQAFAPFVAASLAGRLVGGLSNAMYGLAARFALTSSTGARFFEMLGAGLGGLAGAIGPIVAVTTGLALMTGVVDRLRASHFGAIWAQQAAGLGVGAQAMLANQQQSVVNSGANVAAGAGIGTLLGGPGIGTLIGGGIGGLLAHFGIGFHQQQSFLSLLPQQQQVDTIQSFADNWQHLTKTQQENAAQAIASAKQQGLFTQDLVTSEQNLQSYRIALDVWNSALANRTVPALQASRTAMQAFLTATNQTWPTFVNAAQQVGDSSQKQIQFIQQQKQAWYTLRDTIATALGNAGTVLQHFSGTAQVNLGKVHSYVQNLIAQQNIVQRTVAAIDRMAAQQQPSVGLVRTIAGSGDLAAANAHWAQMQANVKAVATQVANLGVAGVGWDKGFLQGSSRMRHQAISDFTALNSHAQSAATSITTSMVGAVSQVAAQVHAAIQAVNDLSNALKAASSKTYTFHINAVISQILGLAKPPTPPPTPPGTPFHPSTRSWNPSTGSWNPHARGGWLMEPVYGIGVHSGEGYLMAEAGPEYVGPVGRRPARGGAELDYERLGQAVAAALHGTAIEVDGFKLGQMLDRQRAVHR